METEKDRVLGRKTNKCNKEQREETGRKSPRHIKMGIETCAYPSSLRPAGLAGAQFWAELRGRLGPCGAARAQGRIFRPVLISKQIAGRS